MLTDLVVAGVPALALTVAIVAALRQKCGLTGRTLVGLSFVVANTLSLGAFVVSKHPQYGDLWAAIITGLVLWLASMGAWSGGKTLAGK